MRPFWIRPTTYKNRNPGFRLVASQGLLIAALVILLAAGCTGPPKGPSNPRVLESLDDSPRAGTVLRVLVITDEFLPVVKARVDVVGLGLNATTNEAGSAYFEVPEPGRYAVHVHHPLFYPNVTKVVVDATANQVHRVTLRDAPRDQDFTDFYYFQGLCGPRVYAPPAAAEWRCPETTSFQRPYARWYLGPGLVHAYLYLEWSPQQGGTSAMRMEVRFPQSGPFADGTEVLAAEGSSPVRIEIPPALITDRLKENGNLVEIRAGLPTQGPAAVNAYQPFAIEAEFDYFLPAPDVDPEA